MAKKIKTSKYKNRKITINEQVFDSFKEANRYHVLLWLQKAGEIKDLKRQVKYVLIPTQKIDGKVAERECSYIADFVYTVTKTGETVVEDTKGFRTKEYIIKRKLMLNNHGIKINEV